jgi:hypothetical protein
MMLIVDEQELVPLLRVGQADSTGVAGISRIGDPADRALLGQFLIGKLEEMPELLCRQAGDAEAHRLFSLC